MPENATISQNARGLLDLLGLQNFGEQPKGFSQVVVPTVELLELYMAGRLEAIAQTLNTPGVGFNGFTQIQVPAAEVWCIKVATVYAVTEAGVSFNIAPAWRFGSGLAPPIIAPSFAQMQFIAANSNGSNGAAPVNLWMPSGSQFGIDVRTITGVPTAATTFTGQLMFCRLRA